MALCEPKCRGTEFTDSSKTRRRCPNQPAALAISRSFFSSSRQLGTRNEGTPQKGRAVRRNSLSFWESGFFVQRGPACRRKETPMHRSVSLREKVIGLRHRSHLQRTSPDRRGGAATSQWQPCHSIFALAITLARPPAHKELG